MTPLKTETAVVIPRSLSNSSYGSFLIPRARPRPNTVSPDARGIATPERLTTPSSPPPTRTRRRRRHRRGLRRPRYLAVDAGTGIQHADPADADPRRSPAHLGHRSPSRCGGRRHEAGVAAGRVSVPRRSARVLTAGPERRLVASRRATLSQGCIAGGRGRWPSTEVDPAGGVCR